MITLISIKYTSTNLHIHFWFLFYSQLTFKYIPFCKYKHSQSVSNYIPLNILLVNVITIYIVTLYMHFLLISLSLYKKTFRIFHFVWLNKSGEDCRQTPVRTYSVMIMCGFVAVSSGCKIRALNSMLMYCIQNTKETIGCQFRCLAID